MVTTAKSRSRKKTAGKKASGASKTMAAKKPVKAGKSAAKPVKAKKAARPSKAKTARSAAKTSKGVPKPKAAKKKAAVSTGARTSAGKAKKAASASRGKRPAEPGKKSTAIKQRKPAFAAVRDALQKIRGELVDKLGRLTGEGSDASSKPVGDRIDDAAFDLERHSLYAIAEQEAQELRLVDAALEKIENGTYGICEECGERIERSRLKALPYAVLCLKCKEAEEMEQAAGGAY
ncbi:MAG: TraR/DksA C4-type zinc finger protein [Planctomycetes bacterium]|nr:TraR/DksA C4-type zinc finger protein [Planctomycetota bacterium]